MVSARVRTELDRLEPAQIGPRRLDQLGDPGEQIDIAVEGALDPRPQHLDRDLAAAAVGGEMDLRDGGGGDRRIVEVPVQRRDGPAEFLFDDGAGLAARKRRHLVLKVRKVGRDALAEKIRTRRHRLAELDERWSRLVQCAGESLAGPALLVTARDQLREPDHRRGDLQRFQQEQCVVARQDPRDGEQAKEVAKAPDHGKVGASRYTWLKDAPRSARAGRLTRPADGPIGHVRQAECSAAIPPERLRYLTTSRPASAIIRANRSCGGNRRMLSAR